MFITRKRHESELAIIKTEIKLLTKDLIELYTANQREIAQLRNELSPLSVILPKKKTTTKKRSK